MAFINQNPSWVFSQTSINGVSSSSKSNLLPSTNFFQIRPFRTLTISASSLNDDSFNGEELDTTDRVKLAFARARQYQKSKQEKAQNPLPDSGKVGNGNGVGVSESKSDRAKEVSDFIKLAMERAKEFKKDKEAGFVSSSSSSSSIVGENEKDSGSEEVDLGSSGYGVSEKNVNEKDRSSVPSIDFVSFLKFLDKKKSRVPAGLVPLVETYTDENLPEVEFIVGDASKFGPRKSSNPDSNSGDDSAKVGNGNGAGVSESKIDGAKEIPDSVKLAMEKAREYKKNSGKVGNGNDAGVSVSKIDGAKEIPDSVKLAMEKAREYKKNKGAALGSSSSSSIVGEKEKDSGLEEVDSRNSGYGVSEKNVNEKDKISVPSIAFVGLNFSDKKKSRVPAGLAPLVETYTDENLPEVEFIVGDASKFGPRKSSNPDSNTGDDSAKVGNGNGAGVSESKIDGAKETPDSVKLAMEKAREYKKNSGKVGNGNGAGVSVSKIDGAKEIPDSVKLALEKAREYKKNSGKVGNGNDAGVSVSKIDGAKEIPDSVKLAMEKAREYKKNKGAALGSSSSSIVGEKEKDSGLEEVDSRNSGYGVSEKNVNEKDKISVPSIAFVGLNFSDKKKSRVPAGLAPLVETYTDENLPEVEFIVGDASKFGPRKSSKPDSNAGDDSAKVGNGNGAGVSESKIDGAKEIPDSVKLAMERAREYENNSGKVGNGNGAGVSESKIDGAKEIPDSVKLALEKAREYKKNSRKVGNGNDAGVSVSKIDGAKEIPDSVKLAMEKAREYKKNKGAALGSSSSIVGEKEKDSGLEEVDSRNSGYGVSEKSVNEKDKISVPSIAFVGLNFSDKKKSRGLPAGLAPLVETYTDEDLPEVEFLVGDASKFGPRKSSKPDSNTGDDSDLPEVEFLVGDASKFGPRKSSEPDSNTGDDSDVYKPKVSTWGVFPRPSNISKAYGGGKTIRAGEVLETEEEKAAKEARTRKLLAAYKSKTGLVVDPKLKAECEKSLKDGDDLMDTGKLKQALPYYEKVMKELPFQTELHGLAALQWSICQDSLTRQGEARAMYEKLQSHPNAEVKKKASRFLFAFKAMVMLKVTSSSFPSTTEGYRPYFEAFVEDKAIAPLKVVTAKGDEEEEKEGTLIQALPYVILLVSPILIVLLIAVQKHI